MTPNDPLYSAQWHFDFIGDIERVWDDYTGAGINVLVFDDGVQSTHPDLDDNMSGALNFTFGSSTYDGEPASAWSAHGTAVAGLLGAEANGKIGVGVAFDVTMTSFDILDVLYEASTQNYDLYEAAYYAAENFDIINASLGLAASEIDFDNRYSPLASSPYAFIETIMGAYENATAHGRDGLGTIAVYAAGNETMNASGSYLTNTRHTVAVAATDTSGNVTDYSNFGTSIVISAPAANVTTDRTGSDGYESGWSTTQFGGTSAATPIVSGVIALVLEANDGLGWRDVNDILALSASQTGSTYGAGASGYEMSAWLDNGAANWNGGGLSYSLSYGYGMIDAFAATRLAEVWDTFNATAATSANEVYASQARSFTNSIVSSGSSRTFTVTETDSIDIDTVYVEVSMFAANMTYVELVLVTPDGVEMALAQYDEFYGASVDYAFNVAGLNGVNSAGDWSVKVVNDYYSSVYFYDVEFHFYGDATDTNDVYHFTDDFAELAAVDTYRQTIEDTDGGTDWLNFAMIADYVKVRLDTGAIYFGGDKQATVSGGIENIMGGDGNNRLYGDGAANEINGRDGDDLIIGMGGDDLLIGGQGDDDLQGGNGQDFLKGHKGEDMLSGNKGNDKLYGGDDNDTLSGGKNNDRVYGNLGNDILRGNSGNDRLYGGKADDVLDGGSGTDRLAGGSGADTFIFNAGYDSDTIVDFNASMDVVRISGDLAASAQDAMGFATQSAGVFVFDFGGGDILTIYSDATGSALQSALDIV
ncbi:S8 family serine peptidase [Celeribacter sp.]|uniref:S8 family serine peptidase n=1 Tax=Celeribacter sp. TaxID=1890673 RepID=UPI003A94BF0D